MSELIHSVEAVMIILLLTATGYFCSAAGWLNKAAKAFISKFLMSIAVPFMCVYGLRTHLSSELLERAGVMLLIPFLCISACFAVSYFVAKLLKLPRRSLGVFMMLCGLSNTLFIGYPMCLELFGENAIPFVMMYYLVSSFFTQAVGTTLVRWSGESAPFSAKMLLRFLKAPPVLGVLLGVVIVAFDIPLPSLVMSYGKYMNQVVTPLALLVTGEIIHEIGLKNLRIDASAAVVLAFRFLLAPALSYALCAAFGVAGLARDVFVIQAAMPTVTQTAVAASEYGADEKMAAQCAAVTTLGSFVVIPLLMLVL